MQHLTDEDKRVWLVIGAMALLALAMIPLSQVLFEVEYTYTLRVVSLGGALLGMVSGVLGSFAVLRHQSLMGDTLSHAALPGVGLAFLLAGRDLGYLLVGAGVTSGLAVYFVGTLTQTTRIKQDTAMGIALSAWFAAGIAVLAYIEGRGDASQAGLDSFIFGQAAAIVRDDVLLIAGVGGVSFLIVGAFWKEFKLITFDAEFAAANGTRLTLLNAILSTLIVVAIVLGLQLAGVILMVGILIAPGIAARQWTHKLDQMLILAGVFGAFSGSAGAIISAIDADIPTGPMIIVVAFGVVLVSILFAPGRGIVWTWLRALRDSRRFAAKNLRRDMWNYANSHGDAGYPVPQKFLYGLNTRTAQRGLAALEQDGHIQQMGDNWVLTPPGQTAAQADLKNEHLWELYRAMHHELNLPTVPEDRQQDIRGLLPPQDIARLEQILDGGQHQ